MTVLVGPNGSGKSTVLDALLIAASPNTADAIGRAVVRRSGLKEGARWLFRDGSQAEATVRSADGIERRVDFGMRAGSGKGLHIHASIRHDPKGGDCNDQDTHFRNGRGYVASTHVHPLNGLHDVRIIESHRDETLRPLHQLYSRSVERGRRKEVARIATAVIPEAQDLVLLSEGDLPIVHVDYGDRTVPVALAGDGLGGVLRLALELCTEAGGLILLEEPELHQHPGAIRQTAAVIWDAVRRGVQVVLSTHSLELIDALVAGATEEAELDNLSVHRLVLAGGQLKTHRLPGRDVAFARGQIEDDLR